MNETLCSALIQAQLTEEEVAARLQVDPKTVRRWLEGRLPYLRHRWAIAAMLGKDEHDLWPQLRASRARTAEVVAIYPHRDTMPKGVWLRVLGCAQHEIGILDSPNAFLADDQMITAVLADRAESGVGVRICLYDSDALDALHRMARPRNSNASAASTDDAFAVYAPLRETGRAEIRLHRGTMYFSICYADDQLLVSQHVYGIATGQAPVLHLRRVVGGDMFDTYLDAFDHVWADALSAE